MKAIPALLHLGIGCLLGSLLLPSSAAAAGPDAEQRARIEQAIPAQAWARPAKPRRLLIFDRNIGYGGHPSAAYASLAFARMGEKTGAFATTVSQDPEVFRPESLRQFDAVFFNNTVGNLFEDPELRQSLVEFIYGGGGMLGVHGTSVAFTVWPGAKEDWPEFGLMLGGRGANHRDSDERVSLKLDDPSHPVLQAFGGQGFEYRDEFFRVHEPYSRNKLRVLLSMDTNRFDVNQGQARGDCYRADGDYAVAWLRNYGRGRTFYCTIAHNPRVFWDPPMLRFYLAAIQFALGDLAAPTTPSARLTPALRAQESLGWRLGLQPADPQAALFDVIDQAAAARLLYCGASGGQLVSRDRPRAFDEQLAPDDLRDIRGKLDAAGVRLLSYAPARSPGDAAGWRRLFEFARKMGVEVLVADASPASLELVEPLCTQYEVSLALGSATGQAWRRPEELVRLCQKRSGRIGVRGVARDWLEHNLDPVKAVELLKDRLLLLDLADADRRGAEARVVAWGRGVGQVEKALARIRRLQLKPLMFGLQPPSDPAITTQSVEFFEATVLTLGKPDVGNPR